jgi:hypothetical protein
MDAIIQQALRDQFGKGDVFLAEFTKNIQTTLIHFRPAMLPEWGKYAVDILNLFGP